MPATDPAPVPRPARRRRRTLAVVVAALLLAAAGLTDGLSPIGFLGAQTSPAPDEGRWYSLVNVHSGKALEVFEWSGEDGGDVVQWADLGGENQQWRFVDAGEGWFRLINRHSGKALEVAESSTAAGADVVQWGDHGGGNQQWRLAEVGEGTGTVSVTNRTSGQALDVAGWSTADGADVGQWPLHGGENQQWELVPGDPIDDGDDDGDDGGGGGDSDGLAGWATQGGGTTGGGSASPTTVSSESALADALAAGDAVVRVSGTIGCSGMLDVASNTTVVGESGATISGCGFTIAGASNVIVRNLSFEGWDDDAINVEESERVWVDHNSFTDGYDGAVDVKRGSDYVTVSWNRVYGHDKAMLLGHSDDNASQDVGHLRVTYHHNWFDGSGTRHPRVRFGNPVHVYNNLYSGNEYGVASTMDAGVLVEGNVFENVAEPTLVGYADSEPGGLVERDNLYTGSGEPQSGGSVAPIPYDYALDDAASVEAAVTGGAGAGRIAP